MMAITAGITRIAPTKENATVTIVTVPKFEIIGDVDIIRAEDPHTKCRVGDNNIRQWQQNTFNGLG